MPHTTTIAAQTAALNYPYGHPVRGGEDTVCWILDIDDFDRRQTTTAVDWAGIDSVGMAAPGTPPRAITMPTLSIGAESVTDAPDIARMDPTPIGARARTTFGVTQETRVTTQTARRANAGPFCNSLGDDVGSRLVRRQTA